MAGRPDTFRNVLPDGLATVARPGGARSLWPKVGGRSKAEAPDTSGLRQEEEDRGGDPRESQEDQEHQLPYRPLDAGPSLRTNRSEVEAGLSAWATGLARCWLYPERRLLSPTVPTISCSRTLRSTSLSLRRYRHPLPILCLPSFERSSSCPRTLAMR